MHLKVFVMEVSVGFKPTMGRLQRLALVNLATRPYGGRGGCRPHYPERTVLQTAAFADSLLSHISKQDRS